MPYLGLSFIAMSDTPSHILSLSWDWHSMHIINKLKSPNIFCILFNCFIIYFWDHIPGECYNCPTATGIKQLRLLCLPRPRPLSLLRPPPWLWLPRSCDNCCPPLDSRPCLEQLSHPMQVVTLSVVSYTMTPTAVSAVTTCWLRYLWWLTLTLVLAICTITTDSNIIIATNHGVCHDHSGHNLCYFWPQSCLTLTTTT